MGSIIWYMIKAIIFDLGGVYFTDGKAIASKKIANKFGLDEKDIAKALHGSSEIGKKYREGQITVDEFWDSLKKQLSINAENSVLNKVWIESYRPIIGTVAIVKELKKKKLKLYYLSDNVRERVEYLQDRYNFLENFVGGVFSHVEHSIKEDGEVLFERILKKTGEKPEKVVYVDDRLDHTEKARKLGMNGIYFQNPKQLKVELKRLGI